MSDNYFLSCKETKSKIWIGQGSGNMNILYSGDSKTMKALKIFLNNNIGKSIKFSSEHDEDLFDCDEEY